jgi:fusion and transport protein UGO1
MAGMLQYATTAIAMPFEVGKVLLQVQWIPKEHLMPVETEPTLQAQEDEEDAVCEPVTNIRSII